MLVLFSCISDVYLNGSKYVWKGHVPSCHAMVLTVTSLSWARVTNRPDFFLDCPDFTFNVRNKMNTHSGRQKVRKFYNLQLF
jgi:hypothetical protein